MATNAEVIQAFINKSNEDIKGASLLLHSGVLYSYGTHWPLALWTPLNQVSINQSKRSVTSSKHVTLVTRELTKAGITYYLHDLAAIKSQIEALDE